MPDEKPFIIKKYANRRLYNSQTSSHIVLGDLSRLVREGIDFQVLDAKTGADITHQILTQIIMVEEESQGEQQMLPISFLRQLISMYGNSMQALMPHYLEATMDNFRANQRKLQETWSSSMGPDTFVDLTDTTVKMFQSAMIAGIESCNPETSNTSGSIGEPDASVEVILLQAQLAAMKKQLDAMEAQRPGS